MDGHNVEIPIYDFATHQRLPNKTEILECKDIILFEGILTLYDERIRKLMDLKIFIQTDLDLCLARRTVRDIQERGRKLLDVLIQYTKYVRTSYLEFILPTSKTADLVIPWNNYN